MDQRRCLIIADDLTGGADTGVPFAGLGLRTLLVPFERGAALSVPGALSPEVLVINTASRGLLPEEAFDRQVDLLRHLGPGPLPLLYKKIDSTLRGNIGAEIEAILKETGLAACFLAPSYPEQGRTVEGGTLLVGGRPLALTETARDATTPVRESDVLTLLAGQTTLPAARIDLAAVAAGRERLAERIREEMAAGRRILLFDAATRDHLAAIAEAALSLSRQPLLAGSAGLAFEIARLLAPAAKSAEPRRQRAFRHILIVGGSATAVAHGQLDRLEGAGIPCCWLPPSLLADRGEGESRKRRRITGRLGELLARGCVILRPFSERLPEARQEEFPIPRRITALMAETALSALEASRIDRDDLVLILVGGDTALGVLERLGSRGIELAGELMAGIVKGSLRGGPWEGLTIVTKAGAFGQKDALVNIVEKLQKRERNEG